MVGLFRSSTDYDRTRFQMWQGCLDNPKGRVDICLNGPVKLFRRYIEYGLMALLPSRIIYQDIQTAKTADGIRYEFLAKGFIPQVARDGYRFAAFFFYQLNYFTGIGFFGGIIVDCHVCPFARKGDGCRTPHSRVTACNQCLAACQLAGAPIAGFTMVRTGVHLAGKARPWLRLAIKSRFRIFGGRVV